MATQHQSCIPVCDILQTSSYIFHHQVKDRGFYLRQITSLLTGPDTADIITYKTQALPCVVENLYHELEEVVSCAVLALKPFYDCLADKNEEVVKKLLHVVDTSDSKDIR